MSRRPRGEIGGRRCSACLRFKPPGDFYKKGDRLQPQCKACSANAVVACRADSKVIAQERALASRKYQKFESMEALYG